jgi:RimJ/RimL family protein N-acetyltransferase
VVWYIVAQIEQLMDNDAMKVEPFTLTGNLVRLEPLSLDHLPDLALVGCDEHIWKYMLYGEIHDEAGIRGWVLDMLNRQSRGTDLPFAVIDLFSGKAIGGTRYMEIRPEHRGLEIGGTWYGGSYQGTGVNPEAKYLLLKHAFEILGCIRVQFKTDTRNLRSKAAIEKLGAVQEGIFRNHMIRLDGVVRDSVYYSILDREWPSVKVKLEERLQQYSEAGAKD